MSEQLRLRAEGMYIPQRYVDLLHPELVEDEDYDAAEIVQMVTEKAGLEVIKQ